MMYKGQLFDAILLDAPCTASGIVRRQPDVRWLRRESDVAQLASIQSSCWTPCGPCCSLAAVLFIALVRSSRPRVMSSSKRFLHATLRYLPACTGPFNTRQGVKDGAVSDNAFGDHDGFYYALLEKHANAAAL
ncbi:hypothetical protein J4714_13445, partial [Staphylococcus epidermidis]|nr:hypothetical protein [Staphylococcus epidermidis]